jgi:hypothetical protein
VGRTNHVNGLFAKFAQRDLRGEAFKALGPQARLALLELEMSYWELGRTNPMVLTQRWLAHRMAIDPKTAARAIDELETHWFIRLERMGRTTGPLGDRGALYRLCWQPTNDGQPATFENRGWLPNITHRNAAKLGASTRTLKAIDAGESGLQRTTFRSVQGACSELLIQLQKRGGAKH